MHEEMDKLVEINEILNKCRIELDSCAGKIKASELSSDKHVRNIAYALSYIIDIHNSIYKLRPELTPDYLKAPTLDPEYSKLFGDLVIEADSLCEQGKINEAIELKVVRQLNSLIWQKEKSQLFARILHNHGLQWTLAVARSTEPSR